MRKTTFKRVVTGCATFAFLIVSNASFAQSLGNPCPGGYTDYIQGNLACVIGGKVNYLNQQPQSQQIVVQQTQQQIRPQQGVIQQPQVQPVIQQQVQPKVVTQPQQVVVQPQRVIQQPQQVVVQQPQQVVVQQPQQVVVQQPQQSSEPTFDYESYQHTEYNGSLWKEAGEKGREYWNTLTGKSEHKKEFKFFFNQSFLVVQKTGVVYAVNTSDQMLDILDSRNAVINVLIPKHEKLYAADEAVRVQMQQIGYIEVPKYLDDNFKIPNLPEYTFSKMVFRVDLAAQKARAEEIEKAKKEGSWLSTRAWDIITGGLVTAISSAIVSWTTYKWLY